MGDFEKTPLNKVVRSPKRGHYDHETIYGILDEGYICHVAFNHEDQPIILPTAYAREGDTILIHGASKNRLITSLGKGGPCCVTVTHTDGLVLARSIFHHSMNYRSAVCFGTAELVEEWDDKWEALRLISESILPGRWAETRLPNEIEMKATAVLRINIESASAKIRTGPPGDEKEDYELPIWAGVLPLRKGYDPPETDPQLTPGIPISESVKNAQ